MRTILVLAVAIVVVGCDGDVKTPRVGAQASKSEGVLYIDMEAAEKLVKHFPREPDPADSADDRVSCSKAGGDWADSYYLGVLIFKEAQEGAVRAGKRCWSRRQPTQFADAGKPCSGQADCIGNCIAKWHDDGKWIGPRCQEHSDEVICGPIYDTGMFHWVECPVP